MFEFKINLQLFAEEEEDYSLGIEDVETATPSAEVEIATEPEETTPPQVEATEPVQTETLKVKLKYNHEEKEYSLDDVVPLAQKGLNYDKIQTEYQTLKGSPALAYVEKLAKANNMTVDQIVQHWQQADERAEIEALAERETVSYEIAERLYRTEQKTNQIESTINAEKQTQAQQQALEQDRVNFLKWFKKENGRDFDTTKDDMPQEIYEAHLNGGNLTKEYAAYENQKLKAKIKILEQNNSNAKKAPVGSVTAHGNVHMESEDDFLSGLLGG